MLRSCQGRQVQSRNLGEPESSQEIQSCTSNCFQPIYQKHQRYEKCHASGYKGLSLNKELSETATGAVAEEHIDIRIVLTKP